MVVCVRGRELLPDNYGAQKIFTACYCLYLFIIVRIAPVWNYSGKVTKGAQNTTKGGATLKGSACKWNSEQKKKA